MTFTICKKVISMANNPNSKYAGNLLFAFLRSENSHKVAINSTILDHYKINSTEIIRSWITLMTAQERFKTMPCDNQNIFIETCKMTRDKIFIVAEKEDYSEAEYIGLANVIEADDAIKHYMSNAGTTIIQYGPNSQASAGSGAINKTGGIL